jgi:hypothetical protein
MGGATAWGLPALRLPAALAVGHGGTLCVAVAGLLAATRRRTTIPPVTAASSLPFALADARCALRAGPPRAPWSMRAGRAAWAVGAGWSGWTRWAAQTCRQLGAAGLLLLLGALRPALADTVLEGVRLDERAAVAGRELVLNGAGLRAAGWFKLYVAALYLPQRAGTAEQVIAQPGPKRVRVVMLREAPAVELGKAVHKGMLRNVAAAEQEALRARVGQLVAQMNTVRDVRAGAIVDFDFDAARGSTTMVLDGRPRGPAIAGADFYAALLRSFVGDHPYHRDLRAGMLGQPLPASKS